MRKKILITTIWVVFLSVCFVLSRIYIADFYYKKSQTLITHGYNDQAYRYAVKSINFNPFEPNYYRGRAKVNLVRLVSAEDQEPIKMEVLQDLRKAYSLNENNLVTIRNMFPIYYFLAVKDISLGSSQDNIDASFVDISIRFLEDNKHRFWGDAGVIAEVAGYEKRLGLANEYNESVERIRILRPDLLDWYQSFR